MDHDKPETPTHWIRQNFLLGLLALLPAFITVKLLLVLFNLVDGVLGDALNRLVQRLTGWEHHIPGLGVVVTLLLVVAIGQLMRMVMFKRMVTAIEELIARVPVVSSLYNASRQIVVPFADRSKLPFSKVVLVEYPMVGRYTIGLVARERVSDDADDDRMVVFFPSNHLHLGYPVVLSRHAVVPIDMSVEEAVKFFVSCGVIADEKLVTSRGALVPPPAWEAPALRSLPGGLEEAAPPRGSAPRTS